MTDEDDGAEQAVREVIATADRLQFDVEGFTDLLTDDVAIVNIAGRRVGGRDALHTAMTSALASPLAQVRTTVEVDDIRFLRADVALASCTKHVSDERQGGGELPQAGHLTYVLVEEAGRWRIASAQTTPIVT